MSPSGLGGIAFPGGFVQQRLSNGAGPAVVRNYAAAKQEAAAWLAKVGRAALYSRL